MADEEQPKKVKRPTAIKRELRNNKHRQINKSFKSSVRTVLRRFDEAVKSGNVETMKKELTEVYSVMDKGAKRGVFKINKSSRTKARCTARMVKATA